RARQLIARPVADRMRPFRLVRRGGALVSRLLTHWRLGAEVATATSVAAGEEVEIDLTAPPPRDVFGMAEGSSDRVWANPGRRVFRVTVRLPDERLFTSDATLA